MKLPDEIHGKIGSSESGVDSRLECPIIRYALHNMHSTDFRDDFDVSMAVVLLLLTCQST